MSPPTSSGWLDTTRLWLRGIVLSPLVLRSGLFDQDYYRERNPDVVASPLPLLFHYLVYGWREGRCPHVLFDSGWYLKTCPDVMEAGIEPLSHFLLRGHLEGRLPHPLFDTALYREANVDVQGTGVNALVHYLRWGAGEGRDPHTLFDSSWYLDQNPDVRTAGVNPLVHYLRWGAGEGRDPHPLFNGSWYLDQNPDVRATGVNPLVHYAHQGSQEGRSPHPLFLTPWYMKEYQEVAAAGDALSHYLRVGASKGYDPHPLFDTAWYLKANPDVVRDGMNPLVHYLCKGGAEGRDPNPFFDTALFLRENPEARSAGCSPLVFCLTRSSSDCDQAHRVTGPAVLVVDDRFPTPDLDSGSVRIDGLVDAFIELGFAVTFVSDNESVPHSYRKRLGAKGVYTLAGIDAAFAHFERQGGAYAAVLLSRPAVGTRYLMAARAYIPQATLLYDTVDLHWLRFLRAAAVTGDPVHLLEADHHRRQENYCIGAADVTIAITEDEKRMIEEEWPGTRVEVIHNIHRAEPLPVDWEARSGLVFIGGFEHAPNVDGMVWFVGSVLPLIREALPGVKLSILGSKAPEQVRALASESVEVVGYVPRVEPHFGRARVFVSPLRIGAGMKGKIGQAMALGVPVVTTPVGAEGMSIVDGEHALVAADAAAFAARVLELHDDRALWLRLRENALRLVEERFSPRAAEAAVRRVLQGIGPRSGGVRPVDA